ncbi:MAG: DNA cytosine methyltransferase, partial [Cyanobacteria bacterium P01_E01_bin.42]
MSISRNIKDIFNRVKVFSFFAGSGFLDLGFESSDMPVVYINEVYAPFLEAYKYSRKLLKSPLPEYGYYNGNIVDLLEGEAALELGIFVRDARKNNNIVGFIGGPPCPDFSVGGKNRGSEGDRGRLSASYIE